MLMRWYSDSCVRGLGTTLNNILCKFGSQFRLYLSAIYNAVFDCVMRVCVGIGCVRNPI